MVFFHIVFSEPGGFSLGVPDDDKFILDDDFSSILDQLDGNISIVLTQLMLMNLPREVCQATTKVLLLLHGQ